MSRFLADALAFLMISAASISLAHSGGMHMKDMHSADDSKGSGSMNEMKMPMADQPANFKPTLRAFTTNRAFLVKVASLPDAIAYQKHFTMRLAVYDGEHMDRISEGAKVQVTAGMRHGMDAGFAHGMQYSPRVESKNGIVTVSGLSFHMRGKWTLQVDVQNGSATGTAYLDLPCCAMNE